MRRDEFYLFLNEKYPNFYDKCLNEATPTRGDINRSFLIAICKKLNYYETDYGKIQKHIEEHEEKILIYEL